MYLTAKKCSLVTLRQLEVKDGSFTSGSLDVTAAVIEKCVQNEASILVLRVHLTSR